VSIFEQRLGLRDRNRTQKKPLVLSITSGKGGVGKTLTTVNFALAARNMGMQVLIFDGDLGLANVDVVLGLQARYNIRDVLDGRVELSEVIVSGPLGIQLIPSGSGISSLQQLSFVQKQCLSEQLSRLEDQFDVMLIDTGAGISDNVIHLNGSADGVVIVTTPEPHAMTDAYAMIKVLSEAKPNTCIGLVVNMTKSNAEGQKVYERISKVVEQFIGARIDFLGSVPMDGQVTRSVLLRKVISDETSHTLSGQAWNQIARSILTGTFSRDGASGSGNFWQNLLWNDSGRVNSMNAGAM
jgi:flagellar biosynthesis protein FlhG